MLCLSPEEGGPCPAGRYCPQATVKPLPCPRGTFSNQTKLVSEVALTQHTQIITLKGCPGFPIKTKMKKWKYSHNSLLDVLKSC